MKMANSFLCGLVAALCCVESQVTAAEKAIDLQSGDTICLVGNELGERLQHHNFFETLLHATQPDKKLAVRNLCFPGDEPRTRIRSMNFGSPDSHLQHSKASVIVYFFGFNESFAGPAGVDAFAEQLRGLIVENHQQKYDGKAAPRIVLVSPIAFEATGDSNLPDGTTENANLKLYTEAIQRVAKATDSGFVNLFDPTLELFQSSDTRLTLNGSHLNEAGYKSLAPLFVEALIGIAPKKSIDQLAELKSAIDDKNFHWWHRYRAVNGYSIYGARGKAGSDGTYNNTDVMERERAILDQMTANRDENIWSLASTGKPVEIDDSNTLPFINPRTNVGGPDDKQAKLGKLGSLDYLPAAEQQKLFKLPDGYEIQLVASEEQFPELANPVAIDFDGQGRLWVATMQSYPHWKPKSELDDKLLILEDRDNDGTADECKVFAGGLHQPTGFELGRGGVYVAQQPDILFLEDTDGDDAADTRIRKLVGFDTADSHHGISAFVWGPGGNLYFNEGTFKFSQVESPYGLTRLGEAGVWKYNPVTERIGVHASFAFANPWGHVFDRWGQDLIADASPGFSYWAAPITGHTTYPDKHPGGAQHKRVAEFGGGDPKFRFPTFYPKRTRPSAGAELVSSSHFPDDVQGNFLLTNCITDRAVLSHKVTEAADGSGVEGEEVTPIVYCEDGNFRPVDVQFAPDGSLYIVDWHNALIGHLQHNLRDPNRDHSHGRIWRITYPGRPLVEAPDVTKLSVKDLLDELKRDEDRIRYAARRELAARPTEEVLAATADWLDSLDKADEDYEHHRLEGLWVFQTQNVVNLELLQDVLGSKDHRARAAAVRVLSFWMDSVEEPLKLLAEAVNDENATVRLEAVRALSFSSTPDAIEVALGVLEHDVDDYLQYTLDETMRILEQL
ncbi:MAG TPA: azurin [Planctomycetaceae bacterium]|nr:azurin [Planctomycetaceae bacterium]